MATHSSTVWGIPWTEEPGGCSPPNLKESDTTDRLSHTDTSKSTFRFASGNFLTFVLREQGLFEVAQVTNKQLE